MSSNRNVVFLRRPMSIWIAGSVQECIDDASTGIVDAIVTNPTVLANWCAGNVPLSNVVDRILAETSLPLFIQTRAMDRDGMLAEARHWVERSPRIVPKLPATLAGLEVTAKLVEMGIAPLITTVCTLRQALAFASAGCGFLCPYFTRIREVGEDPIELMRVACKRLAEARVDCPILPASIRTTDQIDEAMSAGAGGVIIFHTTFRSMLDHNVTQRSLDDFETNDWPRVR